MITVLQPPELIPYAVCDNSMFFQINGDDYNLVAHSDDTVDVLLLPTWGVDRTVRRELQQKYSHRISVELDMWHSFEDVIQTSLNPHQYQPNEFVITQTQDPTINNPHLISYDWQFNRIKSYYSHFPWRPGTVIWNHSGVNGHIADQLSKAEDKQKIFLSATRTTWDSPSGNRPLTARKSLPALLRKHYKDLGWIGNITGEYPYDFLYPNMAFTHYDRATWVDGEPKNDPVNFGWSKHYGCPAHQTYFKDTFISIYVETIQSGSSLIVTEKTYDPLIKGHFILPFGKVNFVQRLRDIGIQLPNFINYSYDAIEDFDHRLATWHAEIHRLLNIDIDTWRQHWRENELSVLHANQLWFHRRDYDRVDLQKLILSTA